MNWHDFFTYDDGKLFWKSAIGGKSSEGIVAGTLTPRGYVSVTLRGKKYRAHRIIWEMLKGPIPEGMEIDHDDGNRSHNRIENLKLTSSGGNHLNMARRKDNTSGFTGVTYCKVLKKWKAYVKQQGKLIHLGCFEDINDAIAARQKQNELLGFSSRHGS